MNKIDLKKIDKAKIQELYTKYSDKFFVISLVVLSSFVFFLAVKINFFRLDNFDLGKFDLGNMNQMAWHTLRGRLMYLTDYFGSNVPRWSMSHVDPILLLFVPIFAVFPHVLTLVIVQIILILSCSVILYKLARLNLSSNLASFLIAVSFLLYPALGYLIAWTGYHGVSAVIPFYLLAFYIFELMYKQNNFSKKRQILFWLMVFLTLIGKEQISLYFVLYGFFILFLRNKFSISRKYGVALITTGVLWFIMTFFVIIPHYTHYRVESFQKFAQELRLGDDLIDEVTQDNYFLSRYAEFGDDYFSVAWGMISQPDKTIRVFFGGDKFKNFNETMAPLLYMPFGAPAYFALSATDFAMNYLTTEEGLSTSEIYNHRTSMIIPVLFISVIYFLAFISAYLQKYFRLNAKYVMIGISAILVVTNIYTSSQFNNPVYSWFVQSVKRRLVNIGTVRADERQEWKDQYKKVQIGEQVRIPHFDQRDRSCALKLVQQIPDEVSVSGPDYMGAHLSLRDTYALFPALYSKADIVIADIFALKVFRVFDIDRTLVYEYTGDLIRNPDYKLTTACGNLFVFEKVGTHYKQELLPIQELSKYDEKFSYLIAQDLHLVDYTFPKVIEKGKIQKANFVYTQKDGDSLDGYFAFISLVDVEDDSLYQVANLPSFGLKQLGDWKNELYYKEDIDIAIPQFLDSGKYRAFIGITNRIKTRSVFLGEVEVK